MAVKKSFSASASQFSRTNYSESGTEVTYDVTPSLVSKVGKWGEMTYAWSFFTPTNSKVINSSSNSVKSSNGNIDYRKSVEENTETYESYTFSLSQDYWGISVNLGRYNIQFNNTENRVSNELSFIESNSSADIEFNLLVASLSLGVQVNCFSGIRCGATLTSPTILVSDMGSTYSYNGTSSLESSPGEIQVSKVIIDSEMKVSRFEKSAEMVLGIGSRIEKVQWSFDLKFSPTYLHIRSPGTIGDVVIFGTTTGYSESSLDSFAFGSSSSNHLYKFIGGLSYIASQSKSYAFSAAYTPSTQKSKQGLHTLRVTGGVKIIDEIISTTLGVNYLKGIDAGNNRDGFSGELLKYDFESFGLSLLTSVSF